MDCQSTNFIEVWKEMGTLTANSIKELEKGYEVQTMKLNSVYNNLIQTALKDKSNIVEPKENLSKKKPKTKNEEVGDLFSAEPSFQQPAIPALRRTKRQVSTLVVNKMKSIRESATISSSRRSTRSSRARGLSTFIDDLAPLNCPKANSTFVVNKNGQGNVEAFLSPQNMFSPENITFIKPTNTNQTFDIPVQSKTNLKKKSSENVNLKTKDSPQCVQTPESEEHDISSRMTRTMKRKLDGNSINEVYEKNVNVVHVPLEKQVSTPIRPLDNILLTHQIREKKAEQIKDTHLRLKADQKKFDEQHMKVARQRQLQMKINEEKLKKAAEHKNKKEQMVKEETLKKLKLISEQNALRKQALDAKMIPQKPEIDRKVKGLEINKNNNKLKLEKYKPAVLQPKVIIPVPKPVTKAGTLPKPKIVKNETKENKNDYGLQDMSVEDSSEDEAGPRKIVPNWAKRENRAPVLQLQYFVDAHIRDTFFNCPKVMDLQETFEGWNIRNRQRTSSAVWNTPPRFSEDFRKQRL